MDNRDLKIAGNIMALAAKRKGKNKRSVMLRTIMPFLSRETGDDLADAIDSGDTSKFTNTWNKVRGEISAKIGKRRHTSHASAETSDIVENFSNLYGDYTKWLDGSEPKTD
jgi:hypothetical protein